MRSLRSYWTPSATFTPRHTFQYLASPYTNFPEGMDAAYDAAGKAEALLVLSGVRVFCPIVYGHSLAKHLPPMSHDWWLQWCRPFMDAAAGIIVLQLPEWEHSRGVFQERETFRKHRKPIRYLGWPQTAESLADSMRHWASV